MSVFRRQFRTRKDPSAALILLDPEEFQKRICGCGELLTRLLIQIGLKPR